MNNALNQYITTYLSNSPFAPDERFDLTVNSVQIHVDTYSYSGEPWDKHKADVTLKKGRLIYGYTAVGDHDWEKTFHPVTVGGMEYLCFCKTLYGFTLLNTETFEAFDFFPEKVLRNEESYIVADALSFGDFIVFDGCFWGAPYVYYVYHHESRRFVDLHDALGVYSHGDVPGAIVYENTLTLKCENQDFDPVTVRLTHEEMTRLMKEKGQPLDQKF